MRAEQGFLLIEMLVILTILGVSLLAVLSQSSSTIRGNRLAGQGSAATALGQAKIEELKAMRFDTVVSGSDPEPLDADGNPGGIFVRAWDVVPEMVNGVDGKRISVSVGRPDSGTIATVSLSTLIVDIPYYADNYRTVVQHSWRRE